MSDGILDLIDGAQQDWAASPDAMRWNPEAAEVEAGCRNSADFSLAMLPPGEVTGSLAFHPCAVTPAIAEIREGCILNLADRHMEGSWRVTQRTDNPDGSYTFELVPA